MEVHMQKTFVKQLHPLEFVEQHAVASLKQLREFLKQARQRRRDRQQLRRMIAFGPKFIADFGMTMEEAEMEAYAPFWRAKYLPRLPDL
jgi:uncharacterized protein YjiS (DUF1127 family)